MEKNFLNLWEQATHVEGYLEFSNPPNGSPFYFRACNKQLPILYELRSRGLDAAILCPTCGSIEETLIHVLRDYQFRRENARTVYIHKEFDAAFASFFTRLNIFFFILFYFRLHNSSPCQVSAVRTWDVLMPGRLKLHSALFADDAEVRGSLLCAVPGVEIAGFLSLTLKSDSLVMITHLKNNHIPNSYCGNQSLNLKLLSSKCSGFECNHSYREANAQAHSLAKPAHSLI
ncbi:hypothetical protein GH714_033455 [Hevea brasiliensis]|uniref:RNase H type-1 domain-containing protein n=1 Tax=Hevea brasiliensis TaxID=3981 RepID=A0A6A6KH51_HEVBR|nr:hypothetical protein GH714_033455 [Hevea brasiliensis]